MNSDRRADEFESTAAILRARAQELRRKRQAASAGNDALVDALGMFVSVLGRANQAATRFTVILIVLTLVNIAAVVGLSWWQVREAHVTAQDQTDLTLNAELYGDPDNKLIIGALESGTPILADHGGKVSDNQLNLYLDIFQNIDTAFLDDRLREDDLCDDFSHYVEMTFQNPEVQAFIRRERLEDPRYYGALDDLHDIVSHSKDTECKEYRKPRPARATIPPAG